MSKRYVCDRCGAEVDKESMLTLVNLGDVDLPFWVGDLCRDCKRTLNEMREAAKINADFQFSLNANEYECVEVMLRDFADEMNENRGMYTSEIFDEDEWHSADNDTVAEYAARFRLKYVYDTISELREDLQRANDGIQNAEHNESVAWDRVRNVEAKNAKLRELVRAMFYAVHPIDREKFITNVAELGIEVDA